MSTVLKFHHVTSEPTSGMTAGHVYFNSGDHMIYVATGAATKETYGGVKSASYASDTLTIVNEAGTSISLNFSDVASKATLAALKDVVGESATATSNAAATNGKAYINLVSGTTVYSSHNIVGSGATTVVSDANGKITISSTDTDTHNSHKVTVSEGTASTPTSDTVDVVASVVGSTAASATDIAISDTKVTVPTKKYVDNLVGSAVHMKGTVGTGGDVTTLPTSGVAVGDAYVVKTAGTYAGQTCEAGDLIIATATTPSWTVVQNNLTTATDSTLGVVKGGTTSGKTYGVSIASDGSMTVSVPWTDNNTTYSAGTGLSLSGTTFNHSNSVTAVTDNSFVKLKYDAQGHVTGSTAVTKSDITALGIPGSDTDTHYASSTVINNAATSTTTTTAALTNGNVYMNHIENGSVKSSHKISGSGATTVTTDASGNIVISSTNSTYTVNDGTLTIYANDGTTSLGTFTANQAGASNITITDYWVEW